MTEQEAKYTIIEYKPIIGFKRYVEALDTAIKALEEIQQYRALGTVEELRVARDKQVAKKPSKGKFDRYICPDCGWIVYTDEYGGRYLLHCENCGQKLNWEEV